MLCSIYFIGTYTHFEKKKKYFKNTVLSQNWILISTTTEGKRTACKLKLWSFVVTEWKMQLFQ